MKVRLDCGHAADSDKPTRVGDWISCWALMHPRPGCQAQRRVAEVTGEPWLQGVLW